MAIILALEKLFDDVNAQFLADSSNVAMTFGWREPVRQTEPFRRVVWVPGDPSGSLGDLGGARYPFQDPEVSGRPLQNLAELFTCYISASDDTDPTNERKQYHATRLLYDAWVRAVWLSAHGTYVIRSSAWVTDKNERRFGATIRVVGAIMAKIPDEPLTGAPVDTAANISTTELDRTDPAEHIEAP